MPGNACTADAECYFATTVDGSGSVASTCVNGKCAGAAVGAACVASHQCVVGSFCSASVCVALGAVGATCADDSQCNSRYTCLNTVCSAHYTQSATQACVTTDNCAPGLYCKSGACATASTAGRTTTACDIQNSACGADMECSCNGFQIAGQTATCSAIQGTYPNMPTIEKSAFSCLDTNNCGSDVNDNSTVACITKNCLSSYCTYFTRVMNEIYTEFPTCLVSRMVGSQQYYTLLQACSAYQPVAASTTGSTATTGMVNSAGSSLSTPFAWAALALSALFFFGF